VSSHVDIVLPSMSMIHLLILAVHLLGTIARLLRPGGVRAVGYAENLVRLDLMTESPNVDRDSCSIEILRRCRSRFGSACG
jgi:hypothetical protein